MNNWKISIEHWGTILELKIKAKSHADAYIKVGMNYPNCSIVSIRPIGPGSKNDGKKSKKRN